MNEQDAINTLVKSWPNFSPVLIILYLALNKVVTVIKEHRSLVDAIDELKDAVHKQTKSFGEFTICMEKVMNHGNEGNQD